MSATSSDMAHGLRLKLQPLLTAADRLRAAWEHHTAQEELELLYRTVDPVEVALQALETELAALTIRQPEGDDAVPPRPRR
jgi:hypothetical protein